jgi:hypothetical protein
LPFDRSPNTSSFSSTFDENQELLTYDISSLALKLRGLSPRENYTDRVTTACRCS